MSGKEGIPQLILLRLYERFVGRERTIVLLGQKLISQWSATRPPGRGATPDFSSCGAAYREISRQQVLSASPEKFKVQGSRFKVKRNG
jgi:hypothetical protein